MNNNNNNKKRNAKFSHHFRNEKVTGAEMCATIVSGMDSYWGRDGQLLASFFPWPYWQYQKSLRKLIRPSFFFSLLKSWILTSYYDYTTCVAPLHFIPFQTKDVCQKFSLGIAPGMKEDWKENWNSWTLHWNLSKKKNHITFRKTTQSTDTIFH